MGKWSPNRQALEMVATTISSHWLSKLCSRVNLIANLKADFSKHIIYIATHNRTVNTSGVAGRGKAIDQFIEHYNL